MRSRRAALLVSLALLAGSALAVNLTTAGAASGDCPCVILIEVDGLEPKDVTPDTTPFLWDLAHPSGNNPIDDSRRAGWTWQAPRATMTAGTAANAGALLTGSYPRQSGVPADEFMDPAGGKVRLESNPLDGAEQLQGTHYDATTLLEAVPVETEPTGKRRSAAFVGNPALSGLIPADDIPEALRWWPTPDDPQNPPSPAYCDVPRRLPGEEDMEQPDASDMPACNAPDLVTLNKAANALADEGADVAFTYVHLAELGVIKRRDGDVVPSEYLEENSPAAAESVPHALAQTDAALAQFFARYADPIQSPATAEKWDQTFVMVVGSHGYETAPQIKRLPAPLGAAEPDLETYVEASGNLEYSAYGSMATVHAVGGTAEQKRQELAALEDKLGDGGGVEAACAAMLDPTAGEPAPPCVEEVLFVRDGWAPADTPDGSLLWKAHPAWRLDHLTDEGVPTGATGELLITTAPGWAAGRALPRQQTTGEDGHESLPISDTSEPYLGVAGGPRNRAVAAIVNGPANEQGVRQLPTSEVTHYPVRTASDTDTLDPSPSDPKFDSITAANADPRDDTDLAGHERQPETIDFAPTIAALLGIGIESDQLPDETRFLQEAFLRELKFPDLEAPPEEEPAQCADGIDNDGDGNVDLADPGCSSEDDDDESDDPLPPPPEPEVIILPPPPVPELPPPPKAWSYSGLVKNLSAAVGDRRGRIFPRVPSKAKLSYLILRADFGKPLASVKLSFYRRQRTESARSGRRRTVVKTLASFDPFSIKRAKRAKLTLKVPAVFKPTHVGVIVRQARKLSGREAAVARRKKRPLFKAYGARKGGIYRIKNARRLHTLAPTKKRTAPRRRR